MYMPLSEDTVVDGEKTMPTNTVQWLVAKGELRAKGDH